MRIKQNTISSYSNIKNSWGLLQVSHFCESERISVSYLGRLGGEFPRENFECKSSKMGGKWFKNW